MLLFHGEWNHIARRRVREPSEVLATSE
jgi:hypothetical protein